MATAWADPPRWLYSDRQSMSSAPSQPRVTTLGFTTNVDQNVDHHSARLVRPTVHPPRDLRLSPNVEGQCRLRGRRQKGGRLDGNRIP